MKVRHEAVTARSSCSAEHDERAVALSDGPAPARDEVDRVLAARRICFLTCALPQGHRTSGGNGPWKYRLSETYCTPEMDLKVDVLRIRATFE